MKDPRAKEVLKLRKELDVRELTPYQYRVADLVDIYPVRARWHNIRTQKRGTYTRGNLRSFVLGQIAEARAVTSTWRDTGEKWEPWWVKIGSKAERMKGK